MKKNKRYIILIIILIIYFVALYFLIGKDYQEEKESTTKLIVGNHAIWELSDMNWYNIRKNSEIKELNWQEYQVYIDNKKLGNYDLWYDEKWYLFDKDKNAINYQGQLLAFSGNFDLKVQDFITEEVTDKTYIDQVLTANDLATNQEFTVNKISYIDIDQDGIVENFYALSNAFPMDSNPEKVFSFVFMEKNGELTMLYNSIDNNRGTNGCKPMITSVLDADNDKSNELILTCNQYSVEEPIVMLYQWQEDEFRLLISNQ